MITGDQIPGEAARGEDVARNERSELRTALIVFTVFAGLAFVPSLMLAHLAQPANPILTIGWSAMPWLLVAGTAIGWTAFAANLYRLVWSAISLPVVWIFGLALFS